MLCRFYGWTDDYVDALEAGVSDAYTQCMETIQAREMLMQIDCVSFPKMERKDRSAHRRSLVRKATRFDKQEYLSSEQVATIMGKSGV